MAQWHQYLDKTGTPGTFLLNEIVKKLNRVSTDAPPGAAVTQSFTARLLMGARGVNHGKQGLKKYSGKSFYPITQGRSNHT